MFRFLYNAQAWYTEQRVSNEFMIYIHFKLIFGLPLPAFMTYLVYARLILERDTKATISHNSLN